MSLRKKSEGWLLVLPLLLLLLLSTVVEGTNSAVEGLAFSTLVKAARVK
jgi:hypothetical protein